MLASFILFFIFWILDFGFYFLDALADTQDKDLMIEGAEGGFSELSICSDNWAFYLRLPGAKRSKVRIRILWCSALRELRSVPLYGRSTWSSLHGPSPPIAMEGRCGIVRLVLAAVLASTLRRRVSTKDSQYLTRSLSPI